MATPDHCTENKQSTRQARNEHYQPTKWTISRCPTPFAASCITKKGLFTYDLRQNIKRYTNHHQNHCVSEQRTCRCMSTKFQSTAGSTRCLLRNRCFCRSNSISMFLFGASPVATATAGNDSRNKKNGTNNHQTNLQSVSS